MTAIAAIKRFFEEDGNDASKINLQELKQLARDERQELGRLACEQLGETFEPAN